MRQNTSFLAGYAGEIREFVDAIIEKREPWTGADESLKAMRVINELLQHLKGGKFTVTE